MTAPMLFTTAYEIVEVDGKETLTPCGAVDLTWSIVDLVSPDGRMLREIDVDDLKVMDIARDLPQQVASIAWRGKLALPDLRKDVSAFLKEVGGVERLPEFKRHREAYKTIEGRVRRAEAGLAEAETATLVPASEDMAMFFAPDALYNDGFVSDQHEAYSEIEWKAYEKAHPRPADEYGSPAHTRWVEGFKAFPRVGPLHVFATRPVPWMGVDMADVRQRIEENRLDAEEAEADRQRDLELGKPASDKPVVPEPFDLEDYLTSEMEHHHEDAYDHIVDREGLHDIMDAWYPHAGKGTPEDLSVDARIADWNARQTLVSYEPDMTRMVAIHGDDKASIVVNRMLHVRSLREKLDAARDWPDEAGADAPKP